MQIDYDEEFQRRIDNIETGNESHRDSEDEYPCAIHPGSRLEMFGALCREKEKWGMYIYGLGTDVKKEDVEEHLPFYEDLSEYSLFHALNIDGEAFVLFDSQEEMREAYDSVGHHNENGNPFYVATLHKKGPVLNENT